MVTKKTGAKRKESAPPDDVPVLKSGVSANEGAITDALGVFGLNPGGTVAEKLARLREHLEGVVLPATHKDDWIKCVACGEIATEHTAACPFCGDLGEDDAVEAEPVEEGEEKPAAATPAAPPPPAPEKAPKGGKKGTKKGATPEPETAPEEPAGGVSDGDTGDALASVDDGFAAKLSELDDACERIRQLSLRAVENYYDLASEIVRVQRDELWKARGHASFKAWVEAELPISRGMAYRLIDVVSQFDRETFASVGVHKLSLISGAESDDAREKALDAARSGATAREVERIANGATAPEPEEGARSRDKAPPSEKPKGSTSKPKKEDGKITLVAKVDGEPRTYGFRNAKNGKPVKVHAPDSYVEIPLADGVVQRIALKQDGEKIIGVTVSFVAVEVAPDRVALAVLDAARDRGEGFADA